MECINLIDTFDREIEILEIDNDSMIYAMDQKNEVMDLCQIERYDFNSGERQKLILLDYARIYESFQTYSQNKDYFYVINVLQDYRLRLRRISKKNWEPEGEILVEALGEILSIHILNDQYLLMIDEVVNTEDFTEIYHLDPSEDKYVNLCYIYDCYSKERYPVTDKRLREWIDDLKVYPQNDTTQLVLANQGGVYHIELETLIHQVTHHEPVFLNDIYICDQTHKIQFQENDHEDILWHIYDLDEETDTLLRYDPVKASTEMIYQVPYDDSKTYMFDKDSYDVYYEENPQEQMTEDMTTPDIVVNVVCLTDSEKSFSYDTSYGIFSGVKKDNLYVTSFYKEVMVKEYEYHEFVAIHHIPENHTDVYEARYINYQNKLILLKTFLAL